MCDLSVPFLYTMKSEISIHSLIHTQASILIYKREVTVNYISERFGHSNVVITLDRYSRVLDELRVEDTETMKRIFSEMY